MKSSRFLIAIIVVVTIGILFTSSAFAQSGRRPVYNPNQVSSNKAEGDTANRTNSGTCPNVLFPGEYGGGGLSVKNSATIDTNSAKDPNAEEVLKIDTTLVTIPVSVLDRSGRFIPALTKCDFHIYEDGVVQEVTEFSAVETPFHVVLLLDTSGSTRFKIEEIQSAALAFVNQLRPQDKVMVVSFDSKIKEGVGFTNDRFLLREAIAGIRTGGSTKLFDAVDWVVTQRLNKIQGRKAIVLFTDGVDTSSRATARENLELVEESEVQIYPIQYDTYDGANNGIYNPNGRPGNGPIQVPDIWGNPNRYPQPRGRRWPLMNNWVPQIQIGKGNGTAQDYQDAGIYLKDMATRSGGRHQNADSMSNLNRAFSMIAEELRHQYSLGYYPTNTAQDGTFRKVKIKASDAGWVLRSKEGYRAPGAGGTQTGERPILKRRTP